MTLGPDDSDEDCCDGCGGSHDFTDCWMHDDDTDDDEMAGSAYAPRMADPRPVLVQVLPGQDVLVRTVAGPPSGAPDTSEWLEQIARLVESINAATIEQIALESLDGSEGEHAVTRAVLAEVARQIRG